MSSATNHMRRSHRSERYKPGNAGGRNFSRSKYHKVSSARPGLLSGLMGAITRALRKRSREKPKGGIRNEADQL